MNLKLLPTILCFPFLLSFHASATETGQAQLKKEAISIVQRFGGSLKPELKKAMKAQGVETVCMNCHAAEIKPETEAALSEKYPLDKARGYSLGQIRGAFSLARDL